MMFRSTAPLRRAVWLLTALACQWPALASETRYFQETPWELALVIDDTDAQNPYCSLRTTIWKRQSVSIEFTLTGLDKVEIFVRLHKQGWNLPMGAMADIGLTSIDLPHGGKEAQPIQFRAASLTDLSAHLLSQTDNGQFVLALLFGLGRDKLTPVQAIFRFPGNEPEWIIPAASLSDHRALSDAYRTCLIDLKKLGHHRFSSAETTSTSPFATTPETAIEETESAEAEIEPPSKEAVATEAGETGSRPQEGIWTFSRREEDWGATCFVETRKGDLGIGFMASPGGETVAFVSGVGVISSWATLQVDANPHYRTQSEQNDYFGWLDFYPPRPGLIEEVATGGRLTVIVSDHALVLDIAGAHDQFAKFLVCRGEETNAEIDEAVE